MARRRHQERLDSASGESDIDQPDRSPPGNNDDERQTPDLDPRDQSPIRPLRFFHDRATQFPFSPESPPFQRLNYVVNGMPTPNTDDWSPPAPASPPLNNLRMNGFTEGHPLHDDDEWRPLVDDGRRIPWPMEFYTQPRPTNGFQQHVPMRPNGFHQFAVDPNTQPMDRRWQQRTAEGPDRPDQWTNVDRFRPNQFNRVNAFTRFRRLRRGRNEDQGRINRSNGDRRQQNVPDQEHEDPAGPRGQSQEDDLI
ncbi:hypothetical protein ACOME3_001041 [Neoechinorhynchus agilis]